MRFAPVLVVPILATGAIARSVTYSGQTPIDKEHTPHGQHNTLTAIPGDDVCLLPPKLTPPCFTNFGLMLMPLRKVELWQLKLYI